MSSTISNILDINNCNTAIEDPESLAKNQDVLNIILDSINDGILAVDNSRNIIHTNKRFKEMWRIPDKIFSTTDSDELMDYVLDQLSDSSRFLNKVNTLYESNDESMDTIDFNDGRIFHMFTRPLLVDNSAKGRVWCFKDVTLFKENEKKLKDKIAFQEKFINTLPNPAFIKDNSGIYIDCNTAYSEFLGRDKRDILGKGVHAIFPKKQADKYYYMDNELLASQGLQVYEYTMNHADGSPHDVLFHKATFTDGDGNIAGLVGVFSDITEKKRIEEALYRSEEKYRNLFENSPYSIIVHIDNRIIFANLASANLIGFSNPKELIGKNIMDFVPVSYEEIVKKRIFDVQKFKNSAPTIEEKIVKPDGSIIDVEIAATYFMHDKKIASQVILKDITRRKKEEELRKATETKLNEAIQCNKIITEFFANISHEFKTPLNIILGTFQLFIMNLKEEDEEKHSKEFYKRIRIMQQNCYRLIRLVNNLIDITKIDSGYFSLNPKTHNIVSLIENVTLSVAEYIQDKKLKLIFDTNVEEEIMSIDPDSIERIILNLLSNAVKFTNPGGTIKVTLHSSGDILTVSIKDTGIGIPEDKKDIIFDRFRQVDKLLTRRHEGSGIGLSLVKSLVEMHGGTISVESSQDIGTEFLLKFPITLLGAPCFGYSNTINCQHDCVERINIEFSDIYS